MSIFNTHRSLNDDTQLSRPTTQLLDTLPPPSPHIGKGITSQQDGPRASPANAEPPPASVETGKPPQLPPPSSALMPPPPSIVTIRIQPAQGESDRALEVQRSTVMAAVRAMLVMDGRSAEEATKEIRGDRTQSAGANTFVMMVSETVGELLTDNETILVKASDERRVTMGVTYDGSPAHLATSEQRMVEREKREIRIAERRRRFEEEKRRTHLITYEVRYTDMGGYDSKTHGPLLEKAVRDQAGDAVEKVAWSVAEDLDGEARPALRIFLTRKADRAVEDIRWPSLKFIYLQGVGMLNGHLPAARIREMHIKKCCFRSECTLVGDAKFCDAYLQAQYKYGLLGKSDASVGATHIRRGIKRKAQADLRAAAESDAADAMKSKVCGRWLKGKCAGFDCLGTKALPPFCNFVHGPDSSEIDCVSAPPRSSMCAFQKAGRPCPYKNHAAL